MPQALDWVESYARQRSAVYVANTGFGYGDTISNALSERLMSLFAGRLDEHGAAIGELWVKALADYHLGAGAYGVYDEKALQEATFYGLPFWRIGSGTAPTPPTPPGLVPDSVSGLQVAKVTVTPTLTEHTTSRGRYWEDDGKTLDIHYRPIQPRREVDVTVTVPGQTAKGVIITALDSFDTGGVDPATSLPTIDLSGHEPERDFKDTVFPANLVNLTTARRLGELQQRLVLNAGQFRPADPAGSTGIERLVRSVKVEVAYSSSADATPPQIRFVASTFAGSQATILVEVAESVKRVAALYNDTTSWRFTELGRIGTSNRWQATVSAQQQVEVAAMAQDTAGNVGYSTNKGFNFISVTDTTGPEILLESPAAGAAYQLGQQVLASYACSDVAGVESCIGTVPSGQPINTSTIGEHIFVVTGRDAAGRETRLERRYGVVYPFGGFEPPVANLPALNTITRVGGSFPTVPLRFSLDGNRGLDILAPGYPKSQLIPCNSAALVDGDTPTVSTDGGLKFTGGRYHYNWVPAASWVGTCRQLVLKLKDGASHRANFSFSG
ncbi:MAG: PxKF domain-containing protein, partial [Actinomycetota bacterium]|nr:PxKF domain-containing protein [Actinomycetota bacterium]